MPEQIDISLLVTRGVLELDALSLEEEGAFHVVSVGAAGRVWNRSTIEGPYQHGRAFIGARLEQGAVTGVIRIYGATWLEVRERAAEMIEAFSQHRYMVITRIQGVLDIYMCEPADVTLAGGDAWQKPQLFENMQEYVFSAPYIPGAQS